MSNPGHFNLSQKELASFKNKYKLLVENREAVTLGYKPKNKLKSGLTFNNFSKNSNKIKAENYHFKKANIKEQQLEVPRQKKGAEEVKECTF